MFFVNKDASNLSRKDREESYAIASYVQREQYKREREKRKRQLRVISFVRPKVRKITKTATYSRRQSHLVEHAESSLFDREEARGDEPAARPDPPSTVAEAVQCTEISFANGSSPWSSPITILNAGNSDPFNACILPMSTLTHHLTFIAASYHASLIWPMESHLIHHSSAAMPQWWSLINSSISDIGLLSSFLGYASALKAQVHRNQEPSALALLRTTTLKYKTTAIASLRAQMSQNALTDSVLVIVLRLMALEAYANNIEASRLHFRAAKQVIAGMGGWGQLPWMQREYIAIADTNLATISREGPFFAVEEWDPGSLDNWGGLKRLREIVRRRLEVRRRTELDGARLCGERLGRALEDLREAMVVDEIVRGKVGAGGQYPEVYRWIQPRMTACRYRLNAYYREVVEPLKEQLQLQLQHPTEKSLLQEDRRSWRRRLRSACVCVAAMFCHILVFYQTPEKLNRWSTFGPWEEALGLCLRGLLETDDQGAEDIQRHDELRLLL